VCFEEFSEENLKVGLPKRKVVSQPPFSRGDVSFKELVVFGIPGVFFGSFDSTRHSVLS